MAKLYSVEGIVKTIIFNSKDNGFTIMKVEAINHDCPNDKFLDCTEIDGLLTVTGYFPLLQKKEQYIFKGDLVSHQKYGMQFKVSTYEKKQVNTKESIIEYLASDLFSGIGEKTAELIVDSIGLECLDLIVKDKSILKKIPKLNSLKINTIYEGIVENKYTEQILVKLYSFGLSPKMAMKLYKFYDVDTITILKDNPYKLINDVDGFGFKRADELAHKLGFDFDHPLRIKAIIIYRLNIICNQNGHTFSTYSQLFDSSKEFISNSEFELTENIFDQYFIELTEKKEIISENDFVYLPQIYFSEKNISNTIKELVNNKKEIKQSIIASAISNTSKDFNMSYTSQQFNAIEIALNNRISVVTGGPGTGKTTVIKGIVNSFLKLNNMSLANEGHLIKLAAPTGRAAKRMSDSSQHQAFTIHKLLGYNFDGSYVFSSDNLLEAELLIIDESSMIDIYLANQLFQSIKKHTTVVLVGDEDQLPSVGPGRVLKDIIDSKVVDVVKLDIIHRQKNDSTIISLAHDIKNSTITKSFMNREHDRTFVSCKPDDVPSKVLNAVQKSIDAGYDLQNDVQVLIPMYRGICGINNINARIQEMFNGNISKSLEVNHINRIFRMNDKVLQLSNRIEDNVMNGDQGRITKITQDKHLYVDFDGNLIRYSNEELINLTHAYAISVHKSQGSEYPVVILPIVKSYSIMLRKKLIYTAVTRAKEKLIIIGDGEAFSYACNHFEEERQSTLINRLKETNDKKNVHIIEEKNIPFDTLGEYDMENITPYTFLK